jgi:hypothetical protein
MNATISMGARHTRGARLAYLLICAAALPLPACVPSADLRYADAGFLDRIRLDRNGLTVEQRAKCSANCERPGEGTFQTAPDRLVSELHPAPFDGGEVDLLRQADCLWIAHSSSTGRNTDAVVLNWEAFVVLDREAGDGERIASGSEVVSACRLTHPVDRQPICWGDPDDHDEICPPLGPAAGNTPSVLSTRLHAGPTAFSAPSSGRWDTLAGDVYIAGARLVEQRRASMPPPEDFGACDARPIEGSEVQVVQGHQGFDGPSTVDGQVPLCSGLGFRLLPAQDATYRLTCDPVLLHLADGNSRCATAGRTLAPNVMVVNGSRRMARRTDQDPAAPHRLSWRTPTTAAGGRWQENFTPNVRVSSVRFFRLVGGVELPLEIGDFSPPQLCVRENLACLASCAGRPVPGRGLVFDVADPESCPLGPLTPTYAIDRFAAGLTPAQPLTWEVLLESPPADPVYVDFDLRTAGSPPALMASPPFTDFGRLQVGTPREGVVTVSNVGGQTLRVEEVWIDGPYRADFRHRLPTGEQLLPLPVDVVPGKELHAIAAGEDFFELPLLELRQTDGDRDGRSTLVLRDVTPAQGELVAYGERLELDGRAAYYENPEASFQVLANPPPPVGEPAVGWARRPLGRLVFRDRWLPFNLLPGEAFRVMVTAEPAATGHDRTATLRVAASQAADPSVVVQVEALLGVDSLAGPAAYALPAAVLMPRPHSSPPSWQASLLLINDGESDLVRFDVRLTGPDAARFALVSSHPSGRVLPPGDLEHFTFEYLPASCGVDRVDEAVVEVSTNGGDVAVPLLGHALLCR